MPSKIDAAATISRKLLSNNPPSLEIGWNRPLPLRLGPRQANSANAPPMVTTSSNRIKTPRVGSDAKACTEVITPERTRKVPKRLNAKAIMARNIVQLFKVSRFSETIAECSRAVAASHGMKDAFSTGSQNHQPPQPSS